MTRQAVETLVIGGGLAGAAVAASLAEANRSVTLIEREAGPSDKVCGEFLSVGAVGALRGLGLDLEALGAVPIRRVRMIWPKGAFEAVLPFEALSLSRRVLDTALRQKARDRGADVQLGQTVAELERTGPAWRARLASGQDVHANHLVLATGKHELRGWRRPRGVQNDLIGLKRRFKPSAETAQRLAGTTELILFPGGYAGLQPIEDGAVNLCLVVRQRHFDGAGGADQALDRLIASSPLLASSIDTAAPVDGRALAIANIPYGLVRRRSQGAWLVGDQAAVVPSFTGAGMEMALYGARLASRMLLDGQTPEVFQTALATQLASPVRLATMLSLLMVRTGPAGMVARFASLLPNMMGAIATRTRVPNMNAAT